MTIFSAASFRTPSTKGPTDKPLPTRPGVKRTHKLDFYEQRSTTTQILKQQPQAMVTSYTARFGTYLNAHAPRKSLGVVRKAFTHLNYLHFFCIAWLALVWYSERTYPYNAIQKCAWNDWETWVRLFFNLSQLE